MLAELEPVRFRVYAKIHTHALTDTLTATERSTLMRHKRLVDSCHDAWKAVQSFLREKRFFLRWCYEWEVPFPKELLDGNGDYYKQVMERDVYMDKRRDAMMKHHMLYQIP
jgi:hypothetical protein